MKNIEDRNKMEKMLEEFGIKLDTAQLEAFDKYYELLVEWNSFMNLTGITEYDEVLLKHFVDSLAINKAIDMSQKLSIIDVGTGAGFPGLPIKLAFPQNKVTLLDSLNKRIKFLNEVVDNTLEFNLKSNSNVDKFKVKSNSNDIETIHGRAEEYAVKAEYRGQYDVAVSRAVANLSTLSEYCLPFVKIGGVFVAYKSGDYKEELDNAAKALKILGAEVEKVVNFTLPDSDMKRSLIVIKKIADTPKKYPRKAGLPSKEPLA